MGFEPMFYSGTSHYLCILTYVHVTLFILHIHSVTNSLYKLLSEGTLVDGTAQFIDGREQLQFDVTQYIINEVINRASARYGRVVIM